MLPSEGTLLQLMNLAGSVLIKTFSGTAVMAVLSQMIPASVRSIRFSLADLVKLPAWPLCVKKNLSPSLVLLNCSAF